MTGALRKLLILITLLATTAAVTGCEVHENPETSAAAARTEYESPAARYKRIREDLRAAAKSQLNDIAHSSADEELARMAQEQLIRVCLQDEQEATCEGILEMRGFEDPVVTVHAGSVNVILSGGPVTEQQSAVILEMICRETGTERENVKIIPIN